jgi:hypothetical protein
MGEGVNMPQLASERFTAALFDLLDETFVSHHGICLDKGTSFFETLETIDPLGEIRQALCFLK